jgi:hypothetical protein
LPTFQFRWCADLLHQAFAALSYMLSADAAPRVLHREARVKYRG